MTADVDGGLLAISSYEEGGKQWQGLLQIEVARRMIQDRGMWWSGVLRDIR